LLAGRSSARLRNLINHRVNLHDSVRRLLTLWSKRIISKTKIVLEVLKRARGVCWGNSLCRSRRGKLIGTRSSSFFAWKRTRFALKCNKRIPLSSKKPALYLHLYCIQNWIKIDFVAPCKFKLFSIKLFAECQDIAGFFASFILHKGWCTRMIT
jgi:hypothetical protein